MDGETAHVKIKNKCSSSTDAVERKVGEKEWKMHISILRT
jgi:hypothetical protein